MVESKIYTYHCLQDATEEEFELAKKKFEDKCLATREGKDSPDSSGSTNIPVPGKSKLEFNTGNKSKRVILTIGLLSNVIHDGKTINVAATGKKPKEHLVDSLITSKAFSTNITKDYGLEIVDFKSGQVLVNSAKMINMTIFQRFDYGDHTYEWPRGTITKEVSASYCKIHSKYADCTHDIDFSDKEHLYTVKLSMQDYLLNPANTNLRTELWFLVMQIPSSSTSTTSKRKKKNPNPLKMTTGCSSNNTAAPAEEEKEPSAASDPSTSSMSKT